MGICGDIPSPIILVILAFVPFSMYGIVDYYDHNISDHGEFNISLKVTDKNVMHDENGYPVYTVTFASDNYTFIYRETNSINVYNVVETGKTYVCTYNDYKIAGHSIDSNYGQCDSLVSADPIVKINGVSMGN